MGELFASSQSDPHHGNGTLDEYANVVQPTSATIGFRRSDHVRHGCASTPSAFYVSEETHEIDQSYQDEQPGEPVDMVQAKSLSLLRPKEDVIQRHEDAQFFKFRRPDPTTG